MNFRQKKFKLLLAAFGKNGMHAAPSVSSSATARTIATNPVSMQWQSEWNEWWRVRPPHRHYVKICFSLYHLALYLPSACGEFLRIRAYGKNVLDVSASCIAVAKDMKNLERFTTRCISISNCREMTTSKNEWRPPFTSTQSCKTSKTMKSMAKKQKERR